MIVVVKGISASGKSTWCARHGSSHVILENGRLTEAPDRVEDPVEAAAFWAEGSVPNGLMWDFLAVQERWAERQLLFGTDIQRLPTL